MTPLVFGSAGMFIHAARAAEQRDEIAPFSID
jgi:hypothetical protein